MRVQRICIVLTFLICGVLWLSAGWAWMAHLGGYSPYEAVPMDQVARGTAGLAGLCTVLTLIASVWVSRRASKENLQPAAGWFKTLAQKLPLHFAGIMATSVLAAIIYGIIHNQVTARICVEYFTIGHPRLIDSDSPTVLGLFWGVAGTWWVGLPVGMGLAIAARAGRRPKLACSQMIRPIGVLLCWMLGVAILAGLIGYITSSAGIFLLVERLASRIPEDKHIAFLTAGWAHAGSYLAGIIGGIVLWIVTWKRRGKHQIGEVASDREEQSCSYPP